MTTVFMITDLNNEVNCAPEDGGDIRYLLDALQIGTKDVVGVWHEPTHGAPTLIYLRDGDRGATVRVDVRGNDPDDTLNNMHTLRRLLDNMSQQAAGATMDRQRLPVYLKLRPSGATFTTLHLIKLASIRDEGVLNQFSVTNNFERGTTVTLDLRLAPYGVSETPIFLNNALSWSPHMLFAPSANSLPYGWSLVGSPSEAKQDQTRALVGKHSLKVSTTGGNEGVSTDSYGVPAFNLAVATVAVSFSNSIDKIKVQLRSEFGGNLASTGDFNEDDVTGLTNHYVMSVNDRNGHTWHILQLQQPQQIREGNEDTEMHLRVLSANSGEPPRFYVDAAGIIDIRAVNLIPYPGMDLDTNPPSGFDTIADGWLPRGGVSLSLESSVYATALKSQRVAGLVADSGIETILFDGERKSISYSALIAVHSTDDGTIRVAIVDGAGNEVASELIDLSDMASSNAIGSYTAPAGGGSGTWYVYQLAGTNTLARGVRVLTDVVTAGTDGSEWYVDEVYLWRTDELAFRNAIVFGDRIKNRFDYADDESNVNTIDCFNIPGDAPAGWDMRLRFVNGGDGDRRFVVSQNTEFERYATVDHVAEAEDMEPNTSARWTETTDANAHGGKYQRFTANSSTLTDYLTYTPSADDLGGLAAVPRRLWARVRTNNASDSLVNAVLKYPGGRAIGYPTTKLTANNTWELVDLGSWVVHLSPNAVSYQLADLTVEIHVTAQDGDTVDVDFVEPLPSGFAPAGARQMTFEVPLSFTQDAIRIDQLHEEVFLERVGVPIVTEGAFLGGIPAGPRMTRFTFNWMDTNGAVDLTEEIAVTMTIWPRTSGAFIGTV